MRTSYDISLSFRLNIEIKTALAKIHYLHRNHAHALIFESNTRISKLTKTSRSQHRNSEWHVPDRRLAFRISVFALDERILDASCVWLRLTSQDLVPLTAKACLPVSFPVIPWYARTAVHGLASEQTILRLCAKSVLIFDLGNFRHEFSEANVCHQTFDVLLLVGLIVAACCWSNERKQSSWFYRSRRKIIDIIRIYFRFSKLWDRPITEKQQQNAFCL